MILGVIIAAVLALMVIVWRVRPERRYTPDPDDPLDDGSSAPIDREELEHAEREVRELSATADPEDEGPEDDWGPGAGGGRSGPRSGGH